MLQPIVKRGTGVGGKFHWTGNLGEAVINPTANVLPKVAQISAWCALNGGKLALIVHSIGETRC